MKTQKTFQCPVCKFYYPTEELAQKCEAWCKANNSCNLEIIKYAVDKDGGKKN